MSTDIIRTVSLPELQQQLAAQCGCDEQQAHDFIQQLLSTVTDELTHGRSVKIKGIGTFATVADNVIFTPDSRLAAEVNAPFAMFQPMPLPTGADLIFDDEPQTATELPSPDAPRRDTVATEAPTEAQQPEVPLPDDSPEAQPVADLSSCQPLAAEVPATSQPLAAEVPATSQPLAAEVPATNQPLAAEVPATEAQPYLSTPVERARHDRDHYVRRGRRRRYLRGLATGLGFGMLIGLIAGLLLYQPLNRLMGFDQVTTEVHIAAGKQQATLPPRQLGTPSTTANDSLAAARQAASVTPTAIQQAETRITAVRDTITARRYLATMARDHYGCMEYWIYIYHANPGLGHPDRIEPGTVVTIPAKNTFMLATEKETRDQAGRLTAELYRRYGK